MKYPVIKNAPVNCKCDICGFEIRAGNFAFIDPEKSVYCSKKCVREVYPEFKLGHLESNMANLNRHQKIKRLEREIKALQYSIELMTKQRKAKLAEANELRKQILNEKTVEALAK